MNLRELRDLYRRQMLDVAVPPFWDDPELNEFANDAVMEAVRRGFLLTDSVTAAVCSIAYTTNPVVALDHRVIAIRSAIVRGQTVPLERMGVRRMERLWPGWRATTGLYPTTYIHDWASGFIRLYPTPTQAGTVDLSVSREPLAPMVDEDDEPELPARHHRSLVQWMIYRGKTKQDAETLDPKGAAEAKAEFVSEFGERKSARNERWQEEQAGLTSDTLA